MFCLFSYNFLKEFLFAYNYLPVLFIIFHYIADSSPLVLRNGLDDYSVLSENHILDINSIQGPGKLRQATGTSVDEGSGVNVPTIRYSTPSLPVNPTAGMVGPFLAPGRE